MRIRLTLILIVGTIALIVMGCMHIADGINYKTPKVTSFDALVSAKPTDGWYTVTGGYLSVMEGVYTYSKGTSETNPNITELYVPLRSADELVKLSKKQNPPVSVLVTTEDPKILSTFKSVKDATDAQMAKLPAKDLFVQRDVSGMIASSLHSIGDENENAIREGMPNLTSDRTIINDGTRPSPATGAGMLFAGLVLAALQIVYRIGRFRNRMS